MTSQVRGKRHKASKVAASPTPSHLNNTSGNCTPSCDEIRLRAMKSISNAAASLAKNSMIGCKPNAKSTVTQSNDASRPI